MSTSYYKLLHPITDLWKETTMYPVTEAMTWLHFKIAGEYAGALLLPTECVRAFCRRLYDYDDGKPPYRTYGGRLMRINVIENEPLSDDMVLISEYGEIITVGEVKGRGGATG